MVEQLPRVKEWNPHLGKPYTLIYEALQKPKCQRCATEFSSNAFAYFILSDMGMEYLVCLECREKYEKKFRFVKDFACGKEVHQSMVKVVISGADKTNSKTSK